MTERGCPHNCTYCFNRALGKIYRGKRMRFRQQSVDHVTEDIRRVRARYPLEFVVFVDDAFVQSNEWLAEFAEKYPRQIGLPFFSAILGPTWSPSSRCGCSKQPAATPSAWASKPATTASAMTCSSGV